MVVSYLKSRSLMHDALEAQPSISLKFGAIHLGTRSLEFLTRPSAEDRNVLVDPQRWLR